MYFDKCVYTIKHSDFLNEKLLTTKSGNFREYKTWSNAYKLFKISKKEKKIFIILFATAEKIKYLHSWAVIDDIQISDDKKYTDCYFSELHQINRKINKTSLILLSSKKHINEEFIRPYALCELNKNILEKISNDNEDDVLDNYLNMGKYNIDDFLVIINKKMKKISPEKIEMLITKSIRMDSKIIKLLKEKYLYHCQFPGCEAIITKKDGSSYVEVAHIKPVSLDGQSIIGNLIVLCPNHHKEFDLGNLRIVSQNIKEINGILNEVSFRIIF